MKKYISIVLLLILTLTGCGGDKGATNTSAIEQTDIKLNKVVVTSNHFLEVKLESAITQEELNNLSLFITGIDGKTLEIKSVRLAADGSKLVIETDSQAATQYKLYYKSGNNQIDKIVVGASIDATYDFIDFQGSIEPEPYIKSVIALNNTSILVTMSDLMDKASVEKNSATDITEQISSAYRIVAADNGRPREDVGDVIVKSATLDPKDGRRIILTTSPLLDIEYFITIVNIYSKPPVKLIHPLRNKLSFFGIVPEDTTAPQLVNAVSTGNASVLLYFSEPLSDSADDPVNFIICASVFVDGTCLDGNILNVTSAELQAHNTLISLKTLPQQSGINYTIRVTNLADRATPAPGNLIVPNPSYANYIGSGKGAPQVESALAEDNTHVIIQFSERMSDDVLGNGNSSVIETIYRIESPHLDVVMVERVNDWSVRLTTTPQERVDYSVTVKNVQSAEGLLISPDNNKVVFVGVAAKDDEKPTLLGATAESSNTIRLYFSEGLSVTATNTNYYTVSIATCPADDSSCVVGTELNIVSAQLNAFDTEVVLTTEPQQPRVEYTVVVSDGVTDKAMPLPHNSIGTVNNTANFGILLDDKDAPAIVRAEVISLTEIIISFNDSMGSSAADPNNYIVCSEALQSDGSCANGARLNVLSAELSEAGTQVILKTLPMVEGTNYIVVVTPEVTDATGNKMDTTNYSVAFNFAGATTVSDPSKLPHVVGAISTGNTSAIVSFSAIMGSSALNLQNYVITQENVNGEVGTVYNMEINWVDNSHTSVEITTTAQNEVTYRVTVVNVKDYFGNTLDSKRESFSGVLYDPVSAVFAGSPPTIQQLTLTASNWELAFDANGNGQANAGDAVKVDGKVIVLTNNTLSTNENGSEVIDNWGDTDNSGTLSEGDVITGMVDTDGDGIADNEELRGVSMVIHMSSGEAVYREITSDPTKKDTDGDGLTDMEEWAYGTNPRSSDTDLDGLSDYIEWNVVYSAPADQDSDDDGLQDGLEHTFYHTSPILADTDGDQLDDAQELLELNRDPRIADLPEIKIHVSGVNLQIDERFTYVDASGSTITSESSTSTSLSSGENTSFSNSQETMEETLNTFAWNVGFGLRDAQADDSAVNGLESVGGIDFLTSLYDRFFLEVGLGGTNERTTGTTIQIDKASARESQQAYENSLAKGNELSESSEVSRELIGARIDASVNIENTGNVAIMVKNLEISILHVDPQNPNKLKPVATLVSESSLLLGSDLEINLGPFNKSKGPFIFTNDSVYPNLVEELMRDSKSLVFKVVNYDVVDEYDRNFAFANQLARDRTAGIIFDFGELGSEDYYVATNGVYETGEVASVYMGGFDEKGKPKGLPLGYLLENVLDIKKHIPSQDYIDPGENGTFESDYSANDDILVDGVIKPGANGVLDTIPADDDLLRNPSIMTGIIAGADKRVDTIAVGDDVQMVPFGTTGVAPKMKVIDPGVNGVLESVALGDDTQEFISGYELRNTCAISSTDKKRISEFCTVTGNGCSCDGPKGLYRVNTFRNGDFGNAWFARFNGDVPAAADFDTIIIKPGQDMRLAFLQDLDKDGLFAHEEFLYGSTDSSVNQFDNTLFGPKFEGSQRAQSKSPLELQGTDNFADSMDTDRDGIGDLAEAKLGWIISRNGELKRVFSHPGLADSDSDGLWDIQEQDLSGFCADPISDDWRQDALCSRKEVLKTAASGIIVGKNGRLDTIKTGDDEYALFVPKDADANLEPDSDDPINRGFLFGTVAILPGKNGIIDTDINGDDLYTNANAYLPATDPLLSDTDQDKVSDGDELFGYAAAMSIIEGAETESNGTITWGVANTRATGDDVQRVFPGSQTSLNAVIVSAGENGILETLPEGDDINTAYWYIAPGSDRTLNCEVSPASSDSVQNYTHLANKLDPYAPAIWNKNGTISPSLVDSSCFVTELGQDTSGKDLKLYGKVVMTDPLRRDSEGDLILDGFEVAIGSDPTIDDGNNFRDTDQDGLSDIEELQGWVVRVNGSSVNKLVRSNAALPDTDYDGLPDYVERDIATDPTKSDTDGDGLSDYEEFRSVAVQVNFDVNGDNVIDVKDKMTHSVYDYDFMPNYFTGFRLVINSSAHNTNPAESDSDADGLSDYAEAVTGYQIKVTGESFLGELILSNPNKADSDGDGVTDYNEATGAGGTTAITNANNSDTDGDGRSDGEELAAGSLTDPLVPDAQVNVSFESIFASNLNDCSLTGGQRTGPDGTLQDCPQKTNLLWWFYATGSDDGQTRIKRMLSSSDEFAYVPDGTVKPVASGHTSLVDPASLSLLPTADNPNAEAYRTGLKMTASHCHDGDPIAETGCYDFFTVNPGARGYNNNANIQWGTGGIPGSSDNFIVRWHGEIYAPIQGTYKFKVWADDGTRLFINSEPVLTKDQNEATLPPEQAWGPNNNLYAYGTKELSAGWHPIEVHFMELGGEANINLAWALPLADGSESPDPEVTIPSSSLRHSLGNGSFACVGIERDIKQASYISLTRPTSLDTTIPPVPIYEPGLPYYGSSQGSEFRIFVAAVGKSPDHDRYYVDAPGYTTKEFVAAALDLSASRGIISNLVRSDFESNIVVTASDLKQDTSGMYFELSEAGKLLYKQLSSQDQLGQQSFVVRPKGNIEISGVLMKVENIDDLLECPVGSQGVVVQFGASCIKRFSKTIEYAEAVQRGTFSLSLRDMQAETFSTNGAAAVGCDIDLTTIISNQ